MSGEFAKTRRARVFVSQCPEGIMLRCEGCALPRDEEIFRLPIRVARSFAEEHRLCGEDTDFEVKEG